jgi:hypothetical protein
MRKTTDYESDIPPMARLKRYMPMLSSFSKLMDLWSDTYIADSQSAIERTFQTLFPALCSMAIIAGFGDVQQGMAL